MSVALYIASPLLGIIAAVFCFIIIATIVVKDRWPVDSEDINIGFMIRQLIDARSLIAVEGKFAFVHDQYHSIVKEKCVILGTERSLPQ